MSSAPRVRESQARLEQWLQRRDRVAEIECPYCMPMFDAEAVFLCRGARRPLSWAFPFSWFAR
jgi:hypothetical protein